MSEINKPKVGLFVTCLANLFRPSVGFGSIKLLEQAGCDVEIPENQTCCGQPGYNPGDFDSARQVAQQVIDTFINFDYTVVPSGSCAGMIRLHYPALFQHDEAWRIKAEALSKKTFEITSFLTDVMEFTPKAEADLSNMSVTYHDACAGLRELGIKQQPRQLLKHMVNIDITEMDKTEECCGFGGTFCAKMPAISEKLVTDKLDEALKTGASTLLAGDLGCLLNIAGRASRTNKTLEIRHIVEVLSGNLDQPGIGQGEAIDKERLDS